MSLNWFSKDMIKKLLHILSFMIWCQKELPASNQGQILFSFCKVLCAVLDGVLVIRLSDHNLHTLPSGNQKLFPTNKGLPNDYMVWCELYWTCRKPQFGVCLGVFIVLWVSFACQKESFSHQMWRQRRCLLFATFLFRIKCEISQFEKETVVCLFLHSSVYSALCKNKYFHPSKNGSVLSLPFSCFMLLDKNRRAKAYCLCSFFSLSLTLKCPSKDWWQFIDRHPPTHYVCGENRSFLQFRGGTWTNAKEKVHTTKTLNISIGAKMKEPKHRG